MKRPSRYRKRSENATPSRRRTVSPRRGGSSGLHPSLRAAVVIWIGIGAILLINVFTGGTSLLFCLPFQWLLYAGNGALAGSFALSSGYNNSDLPRIGALAGLFGWILPAVFYVVLSILGIPAFGIGLLGIAAWIVCAPLDLAVHAVLGAVGAVIYGNFAR